VTPQEKLKEIKDRNDPYGGFLCYVSSLNYSDANWLVARVEQLEVVLRDIEKNVNTEPLSSIQAEEALNTGPKPGAQE
jgi:hypothetical protein